MLTVECFTIRTFKNRKQLNRFSKLASRHQLGAGCEAVAVVLAHALGEGSGISSIIRGFSFERYGNSNIYWVVNDV